MKRITIDANQSPINLQQLLISHCALESDCTMIVPERACVVLITPETHSSNGTLTLLLAPYASVHWVWQQTVTNEHQRAHTITIEAATGAQCDLHLLSRIRKGDLSDTITLAVTGQGACVRIHAVRLVSGFARAVLRVRHVHEAQATTSHVRIRDILAGSAHVQFYGHALMKEGVFGSDGLQDHKALLLSDRARCQAHPEIQVCSDQVSCAHGSAIGRLPEEQLAYMSARGLNPSKAQSLLLYAFIAELAPVSAPAIVLDAYMHYKAEGIV